ncbi:MAG: DUF1501 domain-containing protein [bacterium]
MSNTTKKTFSLTRRGALLGMATTVTAAAITGPAMAAAGLAGKKLVFVILRGGMDGLGAVVPTADPYYAGLRGSLAIPSANLLAMGGGVGLNPLMPNLHAMMQSGEALALHGVSAPYLTRSHFDSQDGLEKGVSRLDQANDGWLNRVIGTLGANFEGMTIGTYIPIVLQGSNPVYNYAPARMDDVDTDTLNRMATITAGDDFIGDAVDQAVTDEISGANDLNVGYNASDFEIAAALLNKVDSQHAAVCIVEMDGWDTHTNATPTTVNRGVGGRLSYLDDHLQLLKIGLGANWDNTVVIALSEFGRMVQTNSSNGLDHGTGGVCFLAGGSVKGNSTGFYGDFPGLSPTQLFENRDVYPATDSRAILKGLLRDFMGLSVSDLNNTIFPDSSSVTALDNLIA